MPSAHRVVHGAARVGQELASLAERQFVNRVDHKYLVASEIVRAVRDRMTDRIIVAVVGIGTRERVVSNELEAMVEALVYFGLECIVVRTRIVAVEVAEIVRDPRASSGGILAAERTALRVGVVYAGVGIDGLVTKHRNRVHVIVGSVTRESVGSFVAHVGHFG